MSNSKSFFEKVKQNIKDHVLDLFEQNKDQITTTAKKVVDDGINSLQDEAKNKVNNFMNTNKNTKNSNNHTSKHRVQKDEEQVVVKEDHDFENQVRKDLVGAFKGTAAGNPAEAAQVMKRFIEVAGDVAKFTELQKTARKDIEAKRDSEIARIKAQKEIIMSYLEKSFDERKENFSKLFQVIDHAIANNNMQQLAMGLDSINQLAASSPFKALASLESTKEAIDNKNHIWDF